MPDAILLGAPNLWQKMIGNPPRHERATVWQLVEYESVPAAPSPVSEQGTTVEVQMPPLADAAGLRNTPPNIS